MSIAETSYPGTITTTELIDTKIKDIFLGTDTQFNKVMLNALTHGKREFKLTRKDAGNFSRLTVLRRDTHRSSRRHLMDCQSVLFGSSVAHLSDRNI